MNEHHANMILVEFAGTAAQKVTWRRVLPRGNLFLFCVRPDHRLTSSEHGSIRTFCNQRFGSSNWRMASEEDIVAFRHLNDLTTFMQQF